MANRQLEELERAQVETTRALRLLNGELRRSRDPQTVARTEQLLGTTSRTSSGGAGSTTADSTVPGARNTASSVPQVASAGVSFVRPSDVATRDALGQTTRAVETLSESLSRNTQAVESNSRSLAESIRGIFSGLAGIQAKGGGGLGFFSGGLGIASLGLKIAGLFGGEKENPAELEPFSLPPRIDIEAANRGRALPEFPRVVRGQGGEIRTPSVQQTPPQVVVNVNALDTQSFLDRSGDVARAVRDAMLHMHPLNDIVSEV